MNSGDNPSRGMFINACYAHTYTDSDEYWNSKGSPTLGNMVSSFSYYMNIVFSFFLMTLLLEID